MAVEKVTLPTVPEVLLKQRKRRIQASWTRANNVKRGTISRARNLEAFRRAEKYAIYYRRKAKQEVNLCRAARAQGRVRVPGEARLAFVMRTKGINSMPPKAKKVMRLFRLRQINNGVFMRLNKPAISMLRLVEPYVTFGYPNLKTVRDLIYKRGFGRVRGKRIPITSNVFIERHLGKYGIVCMEDLVHEIYTVGPHFTKANSFLSTFKLNNPAGGWKRKSNHYVDGGDFGNREMQINKLVRKIV